MSSGEGSNRVPPVRDACTINNVAYGPGHEKYPSWPMAAVAEVPLATRAPPTGGSQRSKSWTDHTDYAKERVVPFSRPYMKRPQSSQSQQLRTVLENCEKTSAEAYNYLHKIQNAGYLGSQDIPERDIDYSNMQRFNAPFKGSNGVLHQDSCDDLTKKSSLQLTQAELEEYTRNFDEISIQHQKQPSYAQSEGYHSYVSSTDSTSTPFLDRLRRDIESTNVRNTNSWDHDSVVTTSSGSASSSETLKWHGSLSDVSVASSSINPGRQQLIVHSARVQTPQRHNSESILYISNGDNNLSNGKNSQKLFPIATYTLQRPPSENKHLQQRARSLYCSPPSPQRSVAERVHQYEKQTTKYSYLDPDKKTKLSDPALKAIQKKALLMFYERHQGQAKTDSDSKSNSTPSSPERKLSLSSTNMLDSYYKENIHRTLNIDEHKHYQRSFSQNDDKDKRQWSPPVKQKETFDINEQYYSSQISHQNGQNTNGEFYLSNSFNSKVPRNQSECFNSALQSSAFSETCMSYRTINPKQPSKYELAEDRSTLSSDRYNDKKNICDELEVNKNISMNSTNDTHESHNTALQGPIILGPSISLDDWVPERPPKNQQLLRSAFPDLYQQSSPPRMQSPELPLPSPPLPLCEDDNISVNDEPFPPPPLEVVNDWKSQQSLPPTITDPKNTRYTLVKDNKQHLPVKPQKLSTDNPPLQRVKRNPLPVLRPVPLKREYPSTKSKTNEAVRRNSFANSLDVSRDIIMRNTSLRSSVMERGNSQACPQKPVVPSHRNLRRSITVDESNNKKPINPFLRSTSMKADNSLANRRSSGDFSTHCSINFDKMNSMYNHNKQTTLNGNMSFNSNERLNRNLGHFRAEPFNKTSVLEASRLKQSDLLENSNKNNIENHPIIKQNLHPPNISDRGCRMMGIQKTNFDNKQLNQNGPGNISKSTSVECTLPKNDMGIQRAVPLAHFLKKELPSPPQVLSESNLKKHNASSSEKLTDDSLSEQSKLSVFNSSIKLEEKQSIDNSKNNEEETIEPKESRTYTESNNKENERLSSTVPILDINKDTKLVMHSRDNSLDLTKLLEPKSPKVPTNIQTLKPRRKTPAEIEWCEIYTSLISILPKDSHLVGLISQYEVYNSTIRTVSESFEIEISTPCENLKEYYVEKAAKSDFNCNQRIEKRKLSNEDPLELMAEAKLCLLKLRAQLNDEILKLQKCLENNDKLKNELLELLPKNNKILRYTEDIGGVASLIMMIKSRLALYSSPTPILNTVGEQKVAIEAKQAKLLEKLQDAKDLKDSIDKRGTLLLESLYKTNDAVFMMKYHFYIGEKIRLVVYNKDIKYNQELVNQLIKFLEENN